MAFENDTELSYAMDAAGPAVMTAQRHTTRFSHFASRAVRARFRVTNGAVYARDVEFQVLKVMPATRSAHANSG